MNSRNENVCFDVVLLTSISPLQLIVPNPWSLQLVNAENIPDSKHISFVFCPVKSKYTSFKLETAPEKNKLPNVSLFVCERVAHIVFLKSIDVILFELHNDCVFDEVYIGSLYSISQLPFSST